MGANFGIERTNGVRDAENNYRNYGTKWKFGSGWRDWRPLCRTLCTPNTVPYSAVNVLEHVKVRKSWEPTYYTPPPPPIPSFLYLMKSLIDKVAWRKKGKQETKQYSPSSCCNMLSRISVNFCCVSKKLSSRSRNRKGPPTTNKIQKHHIHKLFWGG